MIFFKKRSLSCILILWVIFLFFSLSSYSSEISHPSPSTRQETDSHPASADSHENGHSADRSGDIRDLLYRFLSFTALVIILVIAFRKARISDYFSARSEEIRRRIEELKRDKDDVEIKLKEIEEQLKKIEEKSSEIIEQYRNEGMAEKERIIFEAKKRVSRMIEQSEKTIEKEIESARSELKRNIVDIASKRARNILLNEIGENDQDIMVKDFINNLDRKK